MKKSLLLAGVFLIFSLISLPAYAVRDEEGYMEEPITLETGDTLFELENVIIELKAPPLVDLGFPRIKGFKTTIGQIRSRLRFLDLRTNVSVTLGIFLDSAEEAWKEPLEARHREDEFRKSMERFIFFVEQWARLGLIPAQDAGYLMEKANLALSEFDVETEAKRARQDIAVYEIISNPGQCISLYGRDPHPDWYGPKDQYISFQMEGDAVFEISDENGISAIIVNVNPGCVAGTMVEIQACVPADSEVPEYFMFDTPYRFQDKQLLTVCSEDPITLYIE